MTYAKARLLVILAASAVIGATAIAFASDMITRHEMADASPQVVTYLANDASCEPNTCSIVVKSEGRGAASEVITVR
jgi:hypothetical protein